MRKISICLLMMVHMLFQLNIHGDFITRGHLVAGALGFATGIAREYYHGRSWETIDMANSAIVSFSKQQSKYSTEVLRKGISNKSLEAWCTENSIAVISKPAAGEYEEYFSFLCNRTCTPFLLGVAIFSGIIIDHSYSTGVRPAKLGLGDTACALGMYLLGGCLASQMQWRHKKYNSQKSKVYSCMNGIALSSIFLLLAPPPPGAQRNSRRDGYC